jgi:hypothetical protein
MPAVKVVRAKPICGPGLDWDDAEDTASSRLQVIPKAALRQVLLWAGLQKVRLVAKKKWVMLWAGMQSSPQG